MKDHVESLIKKAAEAELPEYAMKFAQAALNAANAMLVLKEIAKSGTAE